MTVEQIIEAILVKRGIDSAEKKARFLNPDYTLHTHDPYLLNDMEKAVQRLIQAKERHEKIFIYGDYDIDGLTASSILLEAFAAFGLSAEAYIPDRFEEGYGLNIDALKYIHAQGGQLVVTVDCGSTSVEVVKQGNDLGLDIIVTDHHTVGAELPPAVAVINPKRHDNTYPFTDLAGVGVAFKLVQALQQRLDGLASGQEKWLLDLVALGTVCDVVSLVDENRVFVKWGLEVWRRTRRPGLQALLQVSGVQQPTDIDTMTMGFRIGPRLNASGRMKHARTSLSVLTSRDFIHAQQVAQELDEFNQERRRQQDIILEAARAQAAADSNPVLVVAGEGWSHGIVGIVASKLMEEFGKPTFVMEIMPDKGVIKGSARSFGDFKAVDAVRAFDRRISGGGHAAAAGVSLNLDDLDDFRDTVNQHYTELALADQASYRQVEPDVELTDLSSLSIELTQALESLAPFGRLNEEPLFQLNAVRVLDQRLVGARKNHLQLQLTDATGRVLRGIAFNRTTTLESPTISPIVTIQRSTYRPGEVEFQIRSL